MSALRRDNKPLRSPILAALGERVRAIRSARGMTRKDLALAAHVSERHLANLEQGQGNVSMLVLHEIAAALNSSIAELAEDTTTSSREWLLLRETLAECDDAMLREIRVAVSEALEGGAHGAAGSQSKIALVGLRGAGKSTLGKLLADDLGFPFIELSREIEQLAGCSIGELQALYGPAAYRRYERRAIEQLLENDSQAVIAVPGGVVSDPSSYSLLLRHCTTIWLKAEPADHMQRVAAQGDMRPMAASNEAMADLKAILRERVPNYSKADFSLDTSAGSLDESFTELRHIARRALLFDQMGRRLCANRG